MFAFAIDESLLQIIALIPFSLGIVIPDLFRQSSQNA
jgi:hypothetical protein